MSAATSAVRLLDLADQILAGDLTTPRARAARSAAVLGRSAVEQIVREVCDRHGLDVGRTSMRVQLACLRAVAPGTARDAAVAWSGLSRACHQHAYEIAPHDNEIRHLLTRARRASDHQIG
ncbi:hypothetical protein [Phytoactinopolyspora halotolerans]|uniref:Uncharacterized protein n=1 Tax=Phytoactinopolyspora halotolerans TaxID=1981512 RepID=A0A6L9SGP4_9ACTN|nr:hypothetical protein [Phytoactinopolyspora halotolerans]NEE03784.1 hypothetical protein [Phytoactinopolyspora halotolerans]